MTDGSVLEYVYVLDEADVGFRDVVRESDGAVCVLGIVVLRGRATQGAYAHRRLLMGLTVKGPLGKGLCKELGVGV